MSELRVLCWLWAQPGGRHQFSVDHVAIWAAMVRRHLTIPHRLACVTDFDGLPSHIERIEPPREFEHVRIPTWGDHRPQCLRRIAMFAPDAARLFGDRFVCMDLDVVVTGNLDDMLGHDHDFRIAKGTAPTRPYNGSMMQLRAGTRAKVYQEFTPERATEAGRRFLGSDQAWITHCLGPREAVWTDDDGLSWHGFARSDKTRIIFFPGSMKPWQVVRHGADNFFEQNYRGERSGRCLVLGYGANLWGDVSSAMERAFDAVIASPEAAQYWEGPLLEIASDNREAVRLARMHGFDDLVLCGMEQEA